MDLYVSKSGNDKWSGRIPEPNAERTDGPLATIGGARDLIREYKHSALISGEVNVLIRGGRYYIDEPIKFDIEDSFPVTYSAYAGEKPIIDGGRKIEGWRIEKKGETEVWVADVPEVAKGKWYFRQLFVNGERRKRTRLPKKGYYWIKDVPGVGLDGKFLEGSDTFQCTEGDIKKWRNLNDVDVVVIHFWVDERMPIMTLDEKSCLVKSSRRSIFILKDDVAKRYAKYYVENVFEALEESGEWYLDRKEGRLYYVPMPGEELEKVEVNAPVAGQLLKLTGKADEGKYIEFIKFKGIQFQHSEWCQPAGGGEMYNVFDIDYASAPQAACNVPGVISLEGARYCTIENCSIAHIGWYGIELVNGCMSNRIVGNEIYDAGAGGIKLNGSDVNGSSLLRTCNNRVTDNHIYNCGRVFHSAVGVLSMHSYGNHFCHNHIHDLYYSGISCGWIWDYGKNISANNLIEKNHIHNLGHGLLSDMGGIYTLGVQPGTVIRGNLIHDIEKCNYGGWGIYADGASSHILIENNICYNTSSQGFLQNYGRENIVRNNIFAFCKEGQVALCRGEKHNAFTFEKNIVVTDSQPLFVGHGSLVKLENHNFISDLNLFWDVSGRTIVSENGDYTEAGKWETHCKISIDKWKSMGCDLHSINTNPLFVNLQKYNFNLKKNSSAFKLGYKNIDMSNVGPRSKDKFYKDMERGEDVLLF